MLTQHEQLRYSELKRKVDSHPGPWLQALDKLEREEYSLLKKKRAPSNVTFTKDEVLTMLDHLYQNILEGKYRAFILAEKRKAQLR